MVNIAGLIMVKNEESRIHVTLESLKNVASCVIIYDTGSTDNTIQVCRNVCKKLGIKMRLKQGTFVNFEVSRNESLDFADSFDDIDYILLLDCNDELKGGNLLKKIASDFNNDPSVTAFYLRQEWWSGMSNKYFNVRFIKPRCGWRYIGCVHEYIDTPILENKKRIYKIELDEILIYQDRTKDDNKSAKRFHKDKELLLAEYKKNPKAPRTVFYLAQTCSCLGEFNEAYRYYQERTELEGFFEERYYSYYCCGDISSTKLNLDWYISFTWYMKAYEFIHRVEPLIRISDHYNSKKDWSLAYSFAKLACEQEDPVNCILFVDKLAYEYKRWHLLGIVAFYYGKKTEGQEAVKKAIKNGEKNGLNVDIDKNNLRFYIQNNITESKNIKTEPIPTEPIPTEPIPTEPIPTEPIPTEPMPTEPMPTEPIPTEPIIHGNIVKRESKVVLSF